MMMAHVEGGNRVVAGESLHVLLMRWATGASLRLLIVLAVLGVATFVTLTLTELVDRMYAMPFLTLSAVSLWGILHQLSRNTLPAAISVTKFALLVVASVAALLFGFAVLFRFMGPAPVL